MTAPTLTVDLAGETMTLDADHALIWPARRTGFVSDTHFGKAAVFRRAGLAVPSGTSADDLARLGTLVRRHALERLVVLGDFFHARPQTGEPFLEAFRRWRAVHRGLAVTIVAGNHDRHAGDALADLADWAADPLPEPPFVLRHKPACHPDGHVLAGHIHPVARLDGPGGDRLRLPVFWLRPSLTVLPAFGAFTGGHPVTGDAADRLYAVSPAGVTRLPGGMRSLPL